MERTVTAMAMTPLTILPELAQLKETRTNPELPLLQETRTNMQETINGLLNPQPKRHDPTTKKMQRNYLVPII